MFALIALRRVAVWFMFWLLFKLLNMPKELLALAAEAEKLGDRLEKLLKGVKEVVVEEEVGASIVGAAAVDVAFVGVLLLRSRFCDFLDFLG
jgi:hypothetical protein